MHGPWSRVSTGGDGGGLADPGAHPGTVRAQITFVKRPAHPWNSRIRWRATNSCVKNHGWLPNGRYTLRQYDDYAGNLIHGRAFRLSDKRCANGTVREQLFVHTEASAGNGQCADAADDQICRWEYPRINDYPSRGCIKMSPADILAPTRTTTASSSPASATRWPGCPSSSGER
jgi:hypothetical protein